MCWMCIAESHHASRTQSFTRKNQQRKGEHVLTELLSIITFFPPLPLTHTEYKPIYYTNFTSGTKRINQELWSARARTHLHIMYKKYKLYLYLNQSFFFFVFSLILSFSLFLSSLFWLPLFLSLFRFFLFFAYPFFLSFFFLFCFP